MKKILFAGLSLYIGLYGAQQNINSHLLGQVLITSGNFYLSHISSLKRTVESGIKPSVVCARFENGLLGLLVTHRGLQGYLPRISIEVEALREDEISKSKLVAACFDHLHNRRGDIHECQNVIALAGGNRLSLWHDIFSDREEKVVYPVIPGAYDPNKDYSLRSIGNIPCEGEVKKVVMVPAKNQIWMILERLRSATKQLQCEPFQVLKVVTLENMNEDHSDFKKPYYRARSNPLFRSIIPSLTEKYSHGIDDLRFSPDGNKAVIGGAVAGNYHVRVLNNLSESQFSVTHSYTLLHYSTVALHFISHLLSVNNGESVMRELSNPIKVSAFKAIFDGAASGDVTVRGNIAIKRSRDGLGEIALYQVYKMRDSGLIEEKAHFYAPFNLRLFVSGKYIYGVSEAQGMTDVVCMRNPGGQ